MSVTTSRLARSGSQSSVSSTNSVDSSSHNHMLRNHLHHGHHHITSWMNESWIPLFHRHEQIAVGAASRSMTFLSQDTMEAQIQQVPDVRGMLDYLPTRLPARQQTMLLGIGFRQKLGTWPLSKHEAMAARQFAT
ncbi:hypothetical protein B0O99DRAFT_682157 [Bisporella sp. PMI_857]|nr:hypothetical protein B0O99DRAFT_682157 [Bisporella sp. PMI_857]